MRGYFIKVLSVFLLTAAVGSGSFAQKLDFLVPDDVLIQYAGSIGYFSVGAGYELLKNKKGSLDFTYGYVPGSKGGRLHIVASKFAYRPFEIKVKDWAKIYPFNPGVFFSYTFHEDLEINFPRHQYAKNYYYWSEAIRSHLSFSAELQLIEEGLLKTTGFKAITLYSELNSNDFYLINYFQNLEELSLLDVFKLGIGLRLKF